MAGDGTVDLLITVCAGTLMMLMMNWCLLIALWAPQAAPAHLMVQPDAVFWRGQTMVNAVPATGSTAPATRSSSRIAYLPVTSRVFGNTRTLRVYLPPGYDDPTSPPRHYPVLYFNDGFAVFSERSWNAPKTFDRLISDGAIPPIIVVGIPNAASIDGSVNPGRDRTNEFLPYPDATEPDLPNPQGLKYPEFVVDEVMPLITRTYRTLGGPANTGIGGASYGGIAALVTALQRPGVFGSLILESTPLFLFNGRLTQETAAAESLPASVWVAVGTSETDDATVLGSGQRALDRFVAVLRARSLRVSYKVVEGGTHTAAAWAARLPAALTFLYGGAPAGHRNGSIMFSEAGFQRRGRWRRDARLLQRHPKFRRPQSERPPERRGEVAVM